MWVRTQDNEIHKIDNLYSHNGAVISSIVDDNLPIELARYEDVETTNEIIDMFWTHLVDEGKTFEFPERRYKNV